MSISEVVVVVAVTLVAVLTGVLAVMLFALARTLRELRVAVAVLHDEALPLLEDAHDAVRDAAAEVERVERLVSSAERLSDAFDGASKFAVRSVTSPVVKAMAFGTGMSRAAQRLREGETRRRRREVVVPAVARRARTTITTYERRHSVEARPLVDDRVRARARFVVGGGSARAPDRRPVRAGRGRRALERQRAVAGGQRPGGRVRGSQRHAAARELELKSSLERTGGR